MAKIEITETEAELLARAKAKAQRAAELKAKREEKSEALEGETKADAFKRIATSRVNKALDALDVLGNTFNTANYEYTPAQCDKIFGFLNTKIVELVSRSKGEVKGKEAVQI